MKTKRDKIVLAAKLYVKTKIKMANCLQDHFKQKCTFCSQYETCLIYKTYVNRWIKLERAVNE